MKWKSPALAPVLISAGVILIICAIEWASDAHPRFDFFRRLEWITYDWRVRRAAQAEPVISTNLGLVTMSDDSVEALLNGSLPYRFGLHWPRQVHARLINELSRQGAEAVAFDVVFADLRPDAPAHVEGQEIGSDDFFANELRRSSNVILAALNGVLPHARFRTNAWATGDISAERDADGVLRRARPFTDVRVWHPTVKLAAHSLGWDLDSAHFTPGAVTFIGVGNEQAVLALDATNGFDVTALLSRFSVAVAKPKRPRIEPAFTSVRVWQMGITMATHHLGLNLDDAELDTKHHRILLHGQHGTRTIPLDAQGRILIDWSITSTNRSLAKEGIEWLLDQFERRRNGEEATVSNRWTGKLALVASTATGNDLTDLGATPLERSTLLASQHWNVANALLVDRFITPTSFPATVAIIVAIGILSGVVTIRFRPLVAVAVVLGLGVVYVCAATWLFVDGRWLLPIVLPVGGGLLATHGALVTWIVRVEQRERRRTKNIFSKIVSPDVVHELLACEQLPLRGARRHLTVFFADIRGFTNVSDQTQQDVEERIRAAGLDKGQAEQLQNARSEELLATINLYLTTVAAEIKTHGGTLDKYIGDCVMAFWGAPVANPHHARDCVRAVIAAQRAIETLNEERRRENERRAADDKGAPPLPILTMGSGINSGAMTVGLMGSDAHLLNYTVFGREVNLASRLEGISGSARILIGEETYRELERTAPNLAALCERQAPVPVKGFRDPIVCYSVQWRSDIPVRAGSSPAVVPAADRTCI